MPIVDISPFVDMPSHNNDAHQRIAKQWDKVMTQIGFAIIVGHGVNPRTIAALREGAMHFFALDSATKDAFNYGPYGNPLGGYTGIGSEAVSRSRDEHGSDRGGGGANHDDANGSRVTLPDLVKSFVYKPESPKPKPLELQEVGSAYHAALLRVLEALHKLTAASLDLSPDFFIPYYELHDPGTVSLCLAYYPALSPESQTLNAVWYGEHTDYTGFTILHQDEADVGDLDAGGLQVKLRTGEWHAIPPTSDAFVINIGNLSEIWTNGRWR